MGDGKVKLPEDMVECKEGTDEEERKGRGRGGVRRGKGTEKKRC